MTRGEAGRAGEASVGAYWSQRGVGVGPQGREVSRDHPHPETLPGRPHPAAPNAQEGQACIRSERCPICWNPLPTRTDRLSALGETSKRYSWSQH